MLSLPTDDECQAGTRDWPHAPPHRLGASGTYFLTARLHRRRHFLHSPARRDHFQTLFHNLAQEFGWRMEAWAILSNHYHFVGHSPREDDSAESLQTMVKKLHSLATKQWNREDGCVGRTRLWQNFRETHLTHQKSYLARLNYLHQNAAHHRLVERGSLYPWCSAAAFKAAVTPAWCRTIASFPYDEIAAADGDDDEAE